jgi:hypothetical protein
MFGYNGALRGKSRIPSQLSASGIWDCGEQCDSRRAGIWPTTGDLYWNNVSLLLHMDGSNGSTTFTDSSTNNHTISVTNATLTTSAPKYGSASMVTSGSNYIDTPTDADFSFPGDFTVELWVYVDTGQSQPTYKSFLELGDYTDGILLRTNEIYVNGSTANPSPAVPNDQWVHLALTRSGSSVKFFIGGTQSATFTNSSAVASSGSAKVRIGQASHSSGQYIGGKIDEVRITKGVARYTANFTPPTAAFPNG